MFYVFAKTLCISQFNIKSQRILPIYFAIVNIFVRLDASYGGYGNQALRRLHLPWSGAVLGEA